MFKHEEANVNELIQKLMSHLEEKGYAKSTRTRLLAYYQVLIKYAQRHSIKEFSLEMGKKFLMEHHGHSWEDYGRLSASQNYLQRHIMILAEFQADGKVSCKRRIKRRYYLHHFQKIINDYLEYEQNRGLREITIKAKRHTLNQIFEHFENAGIESTNDITTSCIYDFLETRTSYAVTTKEHYQYNIRGLIKYLCTNNLCKVELSALFPVISIHTKNAYPSYFKPDEISRILQCVDIQSSAGKRDYLVLLLAAGIGMRTGDICELRLSDVDFKNRMINFVQSKTGDFVNLPMTDEIIYALADYLKNARPKCDFQQILIKDKAPVEQFSSGNLYQILQKYLLVAEIKVDSAQKHGLHSLRSSLASNMLRDGATLPVIANVLGHRYEDTTTLYTKIDLNGLRKFALEVPTI